MNNLTGFLYRLTKKYLLAITILCFAQMTWIYDHGQTLRDKQVSPNGILDLELAGPEEAAKIVRNWSGMPPVRERITFLYKTYLTLTGKPQQEILLTTVALNDIYWDFSFILFYTLLVFVALEASMKRWAISSSRDNHPQHFLPGIRRYLYRPESRLRIAFFIAGAIGLLDIIENAAMWYSLASSGDSVIPAAIPAILKFSLLTCSFLFILFTVFYSGIHLLLLKPGVIRDAFTRLLLRINDTSYRNPPS